MSASEPPQTPDRRRFRNRVLAGAVLALLVVATFWRVVVGERSFFHLDLYAEHIPVWQATQRALLDGDSPFWLEGEYCGHPALFHQEAPLFYPPTAPLLLTGAPAYRLNDLFTLFHFWLAGLLAFLLLQEVKAGVLASLFGAVAWMLSARMLQSAIWSSAVVVSAYLPAIVLGMIWIGRGRRRGGILAVAAAGGLAILAARPHVLLAASPLLVSVGVAVAVLAERRLRAAADLLLAAAIALLVGAPSWVPTAILRPETSRSGALSRGERDVRALTPGPDLAQVFLPVDGMPRWPEPAAYPGVLPGLLFVSGLALLGRRRSDFPRPLFAALAAGGALGLVFAFGESGPYALFARLPIVSGFRVPVRYLLSWSLAVALGSALVLAFWMSRLRNAAWIGGACLALVSLDLSMHAWKAGPTAPSEAWRVTPRLVDTLRRRLGEDALGFPRRFLSVAELIYPTYFSGTDLPALLREFEPLNLATGMRWGLDSVWGYGPTLKRTADLFEHPNTRAMEMGGVGAVVRNAPGPPNALPGQVRPLEVDGFEGLPRAILVPSAIVVRPELAVSAARSAALDPRRTAVLEDGEPLAETGAAWSPESVSVRLLRRRPARLELEARLPSDGILVVFNSWEAGWRATVDGETQPVIRADGAFQAVRLATGTHRVELVYRPRGLAEGLGLGLVGILAAILVAVRLRPPGSSEGADRPSDILRRKFA